MAWTGHPHSCAGASCTGDCVCGVGLAPTHSLHFLLAGAPGCEPRLRRVEAPPHFVPQLSDSVHNGLPRLGERSRADASPLDVVKRARGPSVPYTALLAPQTQYAPAHVPAQGGTPRRAANFCPSLSLPTEKQTEAEIGRQQQLGRRLGRRSAETGLRGRRSMMLGLQVPHST